ncbi:MAG TPA: hypothetical protein VF923_08730 [Gemmatimonadales bacterium]
MTDRETVRNDPRASGEHTSRRSGVDRRQGLGRRIVRERRREHLGVDQERRGGKDRRLGVQRRVMQDRRSGGSKRSRWDPSSDF